MEQEKVGDMELVCRTLERNASSEHNSCQRIDRFNPSLRIRINLKHLSLLESWCSIKNKNEFLGARISLV